MAGLILAIIIFNFIAFTKCKRLTANQIAHICTFTVAFQIVFDNMVEFKYHGYWYFGKEVEWAGVLPHVFLLPPVNMMFLNWFPFNKKLLKKAGYIFIWVIGILLYETITLLPEPWGYFHYGWWNLGYTALIDPFLFIILIGYYNLIRRLEKGGRML